MFELLFVEVCRILVVEAGEAEVITMTGLEHSLMREECEGVGIDELADLLYRVAVTDQFLRSMYVHAIEACILERCTGNTHVNFCSTCLTKHLHDLERCGTTNDRIVYKHHPFALDNGLDRR